MDIQKAIQISRALAEKEQQEQTEEEKLKIQMCKTGHIVELLNKELHEQFVEQLNEQIRSKFIEDTSFSITRLFNNDPFPRTRR